MMPHRTLLGGLLAATSVAALMLPATTAAATPDLSGPTDPVAADPASSPALLPQTGSGTAEPVVFRPSGPTASAVPAATITCLFGVTDPFVAQQPTEVQATTFVDCTQNVSAIIVSLSLYRQGSNSVLSNSMATSLLSDDAEVHTFTPCQTAGYLAFGTATAFAPPGFSPPVASISAFSNVVLLAATGDAVPPLTCERPPQPPPAPPTDPPPLGPAPTISSLHCEYLGSNRYFCMMSASGWTQIRWTYNGSLIAAGNNRTSLPPSTTCGGGTPKIQVYVSNAFGTATRQDTFRCSGQPL